MILCGHNGIGTILGASTKLEKKASISSVMSVRMEQLSSQWTDFHEIWYLMTFLKSVEKIQVLLNSDRHNGLFHEDQFTFMIISRSVLIMRNVTDKSCRGNQNTHFVFNSLFSKLVLFMRQCGKI